MEARAAMTRWTTVVCVLSTALYALILPALLLLTSMSPSLLALYAVPPTILVCCSAAWYALAIGKLGRARLLCFIPAIIFLLVYFVAN